MHLKVILFFPWPYLKSLKWLTKPQAIWLLSIFDVTFTLLSLIDNWFTIPAFLLLLTNANYIHFLSAWHALLADTYMANSFTYFRPLLKYCLLSKSYLDLPIQTCGLPPSDVSSASLHCSHYLAHLFFLLLLLSSSVSFPWLTVSTRAGTFLISRRVSNFRTVPGT